MTVGYPAEKSHCSDDKYKTEGDCNLAHSYNEKIKWIVGPDDNKETGKMYIGYAWADRRYTLNTPYDPQTTFVIVDMDISKGNSGGPVIISEGVRGIIQSGTSFISLTHIVPYNSFIRLTPDLIKVIDRLKK